MNTWQVDGLVVQRPQTAPSAPGHPGHQTWQCMTSSRGVSSRTVFTSHHFHRHYQNCESASAPQSGASHKTCLRGFSGKGSIAWISAVSHGGRTSNAFKATMKMQTFLFQMVVTSCIYVQYLWKYGFAKSSGNIYASCIFTVHLPNWLSVQLLLFIESQFTTDAQNILQLNQCMRGNICVFLMLHHFKGSWAVTNGLTGSQNASAKFLYPFNWGF